MPTPDKNNKIDVQAFIDAQAISAFQLRVLSLCFLIVALDGFDTAAIGFIAPALAHDWQLSPAQLSPILGAALAGLASAFRRRPAGRPFRTQERAPALGAVLRRLEPRPTPVRWKPWPFCAFSPASAWAGDAQRDHPDLRILPAPAPAR